MPVGTLIWTGFPASGATGYNTTARAVLTQLKSNGQEIETQVDTNATNIMGLVAGTGVLVSSNDTTVGYLNGKLVAGTGITLTENNNGGNETFTLSSNGDVDDMIIFYKLFFEV